MAHRRFDDLPTYLPPLAERKAMALASIQNLPLLRSLVMDSNADNGERKEILNCTTQEGMNLLDLACYYDDCDTIAWLLSEEEGGGRKMGFDSLFGNKESSLLLMAISYGHLKACETLLHCCREEERKLLVNARDESGLTALHMAAAYSHRPIAEWLLSKEEGKGRSMGFDSVLAKTTTELGWTALMYAIERDNVDMCRAILQLCTEEEREQMVSMTDNKGRTPLYLSAFRGGSVSITALLMSNDINDNSDGNNSKKNAGGGLRKAVLSTLSSTFIDEGWNVFHAAVHNRKVNAIEIIINACCEEEEEEKRKCRELLNAVSNKGWNLLHLAAYRSFDDVLQWLLVADGVAARAGFDIERNIFAVTETGENILHFCCAPYGTDHLLTTLFSSSFFSSSSSQEEDLHNNNKLITRLFLATDSRGWTAFHAAARFGRVQVISHLVRHFPTQSAMIIDYEDNWGLTAMQGAISEGIDTESREAWKVDREFFYNCDPVVDVVRELLGINPETLFKPRRMIWEEPSEEDTKKEEQLQVGRAKANPNAALNSRRRGGGGGRGE